MIINPKPSSKKVTCCCLHPRHGSSTTSWRSIFLVKARRFIAIFTCHQIPPRSFFFLFQSRSRSRHAPFSPIHPPHDAIVASCNAHSHARTDSASLGASRASPHWAARSECSLPGRVAPPAPRNNANCLRSLLVNAFSLPSPLRATSPLQLDV